MYSIGEFSRITGITTKALRHYHEISLLIPAKRDELINYRFYGEDQLETAILIVELKDLGFSLEEIKTLTAKIVQEKDVLAFLEKQKEKTSKEIENYHSRVRKLEEIIKEKKNNEIVNVDLSIQEKNLPDMLIGSIKHKGRYQEVGPLFARLGRACGFKICGAPLTLYYDAEYKEEDASYEAAMPIKERIEKAGINVRELKGGGALTVIHKGPYESIGRTYRKIIDYMKNKEIEPQGPSREVYLKGPGFIFRNPQKYVTEIQFLI